jgi:hypothetical protein
MTRDLVLFSPLSAFVQRFPYLAVLVYATEPDSVLGFKGGVASRVQSAKNLHLTRLPAD